MLGGDIDWSLIGIGAAIGIGVIVVDEVLARTTRHRLPPLGVGMGIYLPMAITLLVPVGALIGHAYNRMAARSSRPEFVERMGVLAATGLIVGEIAVRGGVRRHRRGLGQRRAARPDRGAERRAGGGRGDRRVLWRDRLAVPADDGFGCAIGRAG